MARPLIEVRNLVKKFDAKVVLDVTPDLLGKVLVHRTRAGVTSGIIVEVDKHYAEDGVPGFFGDHKIPYALKDPDERKKKKDGSEDPEGITDDKIAGFKSRILDFEKVLYDSDYKDPENGWTKYLDLDSAVDYYLVKEFTKENDGDFYRSNFFYMPDYTDSSKKFHMGPVWDFDRSAGSKPTADEGARELRRAHRQRGVDDEQLGAVLDHARDVEALDTEGVPPTAHPLPLSNVLRDDAQVLRASVGQSPSLADVIKMVHPRPKSPARAALRHGPG